MRTKTRARARPAPLVQLAGVPLILMGLLFLAWTLPFIVQILQYMGEA